MNILRVFESSWLHFRYIDQSEPLKESGVRMMIRGRLFVMVCTALAAGAATWRAARAAAGRRAAAGVGGAREHEQPFRQAL